jgi:CRP/FNR family transcriptional regulator
VGFDGEFRKGVSVETATQSSLCRIDRRTFDRLVNRNDTLRAELFHQKQDQLDRFHWLTWSLGALIPEERLCAFLALASRFMPYQTLTDGSGVLSVILPRKDIADLLGTTVESISRIIHNLSNTGVIEIRDPTHLRLHNVRKLVSLGQIDGMFDRMTAGIATRRSQLDAMLTSGVADSVYFCCR